MTPVVCRYGKSESEISFQFGVPHAIILSEAIPSVNLPPSREPRRAMKHPTNIKPSAELSIEIPLSDAEQRDLERIESLIAAKLAAFFKVGFALTEIKNRRLYRAEYKSFEEYCHKRWEMNRSHAYRLIGAAEVCKVLSPIGDIPLPENECQIRPLVGLRPAIAAKAWKKAWEKAGSRGVVTSTLVQKAVAEVLPSRGRTRSPGLQHWQALIHPLLEEAARLTRKGDQDGLSEIIDRISALLLVGRRRALDDNLR